MNQRKIRVKKWKKSDNKGSYKERWKHVEVLKEKGWIQGKVNVGPSQMLRLKRNIRQPTRYINSGDNEEEQESPISNDESRGKGDWFCQECLNDDGMAIMLVLTTVNISFTKRFLQQILLEKYRKQNASVYVVIFFWFSDSWENCISLFCLYKVSKYIFKHPVRLWRLFFSNIL